MEKTNWIDVGTFMLTGPTMRVTDPCYARDVWCSGAIADCRTGNWKAKVYQSDEQEWGLRNALLVVQHERCKKTLAGLKCDMKKPPRGFIGMTFEIGVDSGQAGFFDDTFYQDESVIDPKSITYDFSSWSHAEKWWYKACCDKTLQYPDAGVIPFGAVSSSGFGDGSYFGGFHRDRSGLIDMAFISFI